MSDLKTFRLGLAAVAGLGAFAASAMAQQPPAAPPPITMKQLTPDVWAGLGGAGGNSTIIIGKTGVIVVDAKQTEAGAKDLLAEIAKITPKPVTTVILTHSDGDHVNGLVAYPVGIKIIAHENNKKELEAAIAAGGRGAPPRRSSPDTGHHEAEGNDDDRRREARAVPLGARAYERRPDRLPAGSEDRGDRRYHRDEPRRR